MKLIGKIILILGGALIALVLALFAALSIFDSPTYARRILTYGESDTGDIDRFPARPILSASTASVLPVEVADIPETVTWSYLGVQNTEKLSDLIRRNQTEAFLIARGDRIIFDFYNHREAGDPHTSFSSVKSVNSALIGAAIADGYIESVDDPVIRYVPEIAGRGLDRLTVRDLLLMNSGIKYLDDEELPLYRIPFGYGAITYYSSDLRRVALSVEAGDTPVGAAFRYNNYHPLLEGLIIERVTGMHVAEYLQERIWKPMGAQFPASWSMDSTASGFEKMESGLNAAPVDYARFGLIFLHKGYWNGGQILPEEWVEESTSPLRPDPRRWESARSWPDYGGYYKYHWWGINNPDGTYDFYAHGKYNQIVYVAPRKNVVIVRLGKAPDEAIRWPLIFQAIVNQMPEE